MAKYKLIYYPYPNLEKRISKPIEGLDNARKKACAILLENSKRNPRDTSSGPIYIQNVLHTSSTYAHIWSPYMGRFYYLGAWGEQGAIYSINPKTGKRMTLIGYED